MRLGPIPRPTVFIRRPRRVKFGLVDGCTGSYGWKSHTQTGTASINAHTGVPTGAKFTLLSHAAAKTPIKQHDLGSKGSSIAI